MKRLRVLLLALPLACGPAEDAPLEEDPAAEACHHAGEGPFVHLDAATTPEAAPDVAADHQGYRLALPAGETGWVRLAVAQAGHLHFFLSKEVAFFIEDDVGAGVTFEATEAVDCEALAVAHAADLGVGAHRLSFGPVADPSTVTLVVEGSGHDHEH